MEPISLPGITVYQEPDTVSLAAPAVSDDQVSLSAPVQTTLPPDLVEKRASKIHEGLGPVLEKDKDSIRQDLNNGAEKNIRQEAATKLDLLAAKKLQRTVRSIPFDSDITPEEVDAIIAKNTPAKVDPDTVVEKAYGNAFIDNPIEKAVQNLPNSPVAQAKQEIPAAYEALKDKAKETTSRIQYATTVREDLALQIHDQSWPGYLADFGKTMFQPYVEYKMRGLNPDVGKISGGIGLGTNLQKQADDLLSPVITPDFETYKEKFRNIVDTLAKDNPSLAYKFAEYVEGVGTTDRYLDNTFTALTIPDYLAMGKLGFAIVRRINLANRTNQALKQLVKTAGDIEAKKAESIVPQTTPPEAPSTALPRAEALGDVPSAVVERASKNITDEISGKSDPIKTATDESLVTFLNQDAKGIETNPGPLSREQTVRVLDAYKASAASILDKLNNALRINRIPLPVAVENAVRIIKESVKDYYPGIRNAILDISNPQYEQKSNTYWHEVTLGNLGGDLFSNPKTAKNFMELHGINGEVIEGTGRVTPARTEQLLERRAQLEENVKAAEEGIDNNLARSKDKKLSAEDRAKALEQHEGLQSHKSAFEKEIEDINLKLKGQDTVYRVQGLEGETAQLRSKNKELRASLKLGKHDEETAARLKESIAWAEDKITGNLNEIKAIKSGKAEVIGSHNTVEQHGVGYKIVVRRPLVETDKVVRDLMVKDAHGNLVKEASSLNSETGWRALFNGALEGLPNKLRTAEDTLSLNENIQRKIGTYSQSLFKQWAHDEIKYIKDLVRGNLREDPVTGEPLKFWQTSYNPSRQTFDEWKRTVDHARTAPDPDTGRTGYFFRTPGEIYAHYRTFFDRAPSFAEIQAYFAYTRLVEGDRIFREIAEFRNRARLGTEQHQISFRGPDGKTITSDYFDGVMKKVFPGGDDVMLILGRRKGDEKIINLGGLGIDSKTLERYRKDVELGKLKVIEVYAPEHTPLRSFSDIAGNEHIRYILTDSVNTKPIEFNHVNRVGGGHFEYDYSHYIKQATMYHQYEQSAGIKGKYKSVYYGDKTFMPVENGAKGRDIAERMNVGRELLRDGKTEEARAWVEEKLPIEFDKFQDMFKAGRDENNRVVPAKYDLHEPFTVVPNGKSVQDMDSSLQERYGKSFKDGTRSGSLNKQFSTAFNTERDAAGLKTFIEDGLDSQGNPTYKYAPANLVDPIDTMQRALNRITSSVFMDDYKLYAIEHWLREAEPYLTNVNHDLARSTPFFVFKSAKDSSAFRSGVPEYIKGNLLANRFKIEQFVGIPSKLDTAIQSAIEKLTDANWEGGIVTKVGTTPAIYALEHIKDPVTAMRVITSHLKLGMFNPVQFLVQNQTWTAIHALSPSQASASTLATTLHTMTLAKADDAFLNHLDKVATQLNIPGQSRWKPGEFLEAYKTLEKTGFNKVAGEYSDINTALKSDFFEMNDAKELFNGPGMAPFRKGEQSTRLGAWYAAFKEFREAEPAKILTRDDIGSILQRADLLSGNMSRASHSLLNQGIFSLPTQFLSYTLRQAELFWSKRTGETATERAMTRGRLLLFNSLMYGAPVGLGVSGFVFMDALRQEAIQRGYNVNDNWYSTVAMEGLPSFFVTRMLGFTPNIGDRFGSQGLTQFRDALKSDKPWYSMLAGASGTTLAGIMGSLSPFWRGVQSMLEPNNKDKLHPIKVDDFVGLFKEWSAFNQAWKLVMALNTGRWMSKNEVNITDVSKAEALFYGLTGTNPQKQDDAYAKANIRKTEIEIQKHALKEFIKEYHRYLDAAKDNNTQGAQDYYRRADAILEFAGYPLDKKATAIRLANKAYRGQIEDTDFEFFTKDVPQSRNDFMGIPMPFKTQTGIPRVRREQYRREQQIDREMK